MDNSLLISIIIAILITLFFTLGPVNNYSQKSLNSKNKGIEEMSSEEIITDFNLLLNKEKFGTQHYSNNINGGNDYDKGNSSWNMYTQAPYYFIKTHPDKPVFYEKPIYRKPYNFPVQYESSYPTNYFKLFEN